MITITIPKIFQPDIFFVDDEEEVDVLFGGVDDEKEVDVLFGGLEVLDRSLISSSS